ncbi:MAG: hypothetical protein JJU09_10215 [Rhodobacteraceae bacterium]|nr:hypothetical protein [Paracoccaceae bacterium]TVR47284.1 MAG: hypothetical protein EA386_08180 [Paracoccaceae bacterium]
MRTDPDTDRLSVCHFCPKASAFVASISKGVSLARSVTGDAPTLSGRVALGPCPLGQPCHLVWTSRGGRTILRRDGVKIMSKRAGRGFFA